MRGASYRLRQHAERDSVSPHQLHRELLQRILGQVLNRLVGVLMGFECSLNPFSCKPCYEALAHLPPVQRIKALGQSATRQAILSEADRNPHLFMEYFGHNYAGMYPWRGAEPCYLPSPEESVQTLADAAGVAPLEWMYDFMLGNDGQALVYLPMANYINHDCGALQELLKHPYTMPALGDGGAHVGTICDGSATTFLLTEWVRHRSVFKLEEAVQLLPQRPASLYGFADRGSLQVGKLADKKKEAAASFKSRRQARRTGYSSTVLKFFLLAQAATELSGSCSAA